jgi:hypothetical protein
MGKWENGKMGKWENGNSGTKLHPLLVFFLRVENAVKRENKEKEG